MEITNADVLIIGGGLAGLMAAISASRYTKNIVIVSKGPIGKSGNTLVSGGGIASVTKNQDNSVETFYKDLNVSGQGLNNSQLTKKLAEESPYMLEILDKLGVKLVKEGRFYKRRQPPGHSVPRNIPTDWTGFSYLNRGLSFTLPLLDKVNELNITLVEGITIVKLLKDVGRVTGAIGSDKDNNLYLFSSRSTILAAGGGGHIFYKTNNTKDISGDAFALALDAGCKLQDMEQVQFYPTMMHKPIKMPISNPLFGAGAVLLNKDKEEFMFNYDSAGNMTTRDIMARAIFFEIQENRGIGEHVYFDCTKIPIEILKSTFKDFYEFLLKKGIDPTQQYLLVSPSVHYFLGGIVIDEHCGTGIPGLYAAGEACGGVHGANRLSGAALMEACVFGWQAGKTATEADVSISKNINKQLFEKLELDSSGNSKELIKILQIEMWEQASIVRNEESLKQILNKINSSINNLSDRFSFNTIRYKNMLKVAKAITISALMRKESRGAHYRSDYPVINNKYYGNVICFEENDEIKVEFQAKCE